MSGRGIKRTNDFSGIFALCQLLRYRSKYSWSLPGNYLQCLECLKLGVNTKFVWGLPEDIQRVFEQQQNHLRSVTSDRSAVNGILAQLTPVSSSSSSSSS